MGWIEGGSEGPEALALRIHAAHALGCQWSAHSRLCYYYSCTHLFFAGFKNFFPTAVETLGFGETVTLVLTCPPYLIAGFISVYWSWQSGRYNERTWHITSAKIVAIFGFVLAAATLNTGARYFAMVVFAIGTYAVNSIILGWVSATCGQTKEKKASSLAIVNTIANVSFIWTPVCFTLDTIKPLC
jgi:hypothetical protein